MLCLGDSWHQFDECLLVDSRLGDLWCLWDEGLVGVLCLDVLRWLDGNLCLLGVQTCLSCCMSAGWPFLHLSPKSDSPLR